MRLEVDNAMILVAKLMKDGANELFAGSRYGDTVSMGRKALRELKMAPSPDGAAHAALGADARPPLELGSVLHQVAPG
jgi:hypothetical protein